MRASRALALGMTAVMLSASCARQPYRDPLLTAQREAVERGRVRPPDVRDTPNVTEGLDLAIAERTAHLNVRGSRSGTNLRSAPRPAAIATRPAGDVQPAGAGACGGDLPPCWVLRKENRNADPTLWNGGCRHPVGFTGKNPCGSTASGKWQITRGTWGSRLVGGVWHPGHGGYMNAADAPLDVQDDKARALWAGGRGCAHWAAC